MLDVCIFHYMYLFAQGETEKNLVLEAKADNILEGEESFIVSLVSSDNNADISPTGISFLFLFEQVVTCLLFIRCTKTESIPRNSQINSLLKSNTFEEIAVRP